MNVSIIKAAINEAEKSNCRFRIGCVIFKGKHIISKAHNEFRYKSNLHPKYKRFKFSLHAEQSAILNARKDLKRANILVVRLNNDGELLLAKPCKYCQAYIEKVGIRKVYYTNNIGEISLYEESRRD